MDSHKPHKHGAHRFHDQDHARDYDQRAARSDIRAQLTPKLLEALRLRGNERVLDLATGTGRFARPVAERLKGGWAVGLDEALAMLRVAQEKDPIPGFHPAAGKAEAFPFKAGTFDRVFTVFALHHFSRPPETIREAFRVMRSGGRIVVLDPVVVTSDDELDENIHARINQILAEAQGEDFYYHSADGIEDLLRRAGFQDVGRSLQTFSVDQEGMEGIPTGRHWLEVAEQLEDDPAELKRRFEERYFRYEKKGDTVRVRGNFYFALVFGEKRG